MSLPSSGPNGCVEESALGEWFRLGEEIGRGATGRVYKAENLVSGQTVAIKKIPLGPTAAQQQSNLQCLMGEIELLKSLNHQNIVQFLGSCRTRTHLYIMLEYMEKGSLSSIIKQGVKLSEELAAVYIAQVLQGLRYLHAQGVVHRDIKGANILTNKQVRMPRQHGHAWAAAACTEQLCGRPGQRESLVGWGPVSNHADGRLHGHSYACACARGEHTEQAGGQRTHAAADAALFDHPLGSGAAQGVVKLADFGVSSRLGELELHQGLQQHVAGSPYWMAPEVKLLRPACWWRVEGYCGCAWHQR